MSKFTFCEKKIMSYIDQNFADDRYVAVFWPISIRLVNWFFSYNWQKKVCAANEVNHCLWRCWNSEGWSRRFWSLIYVISVANVRRSNSRTINFLILGICLPCNLDAVPGTAVRCMALPKRPPIADPRGRPPIAELWRENGLPAAAVMADPLRDIGLVAVVGLWPPLVTGLGPGPRDEAGLSPGIIRSSSSKSISF